GAPPTEDEVRVDAQLATSLRMLGLLPPGQTSSDEAAIAAYASSVLAFYSRADASVTIVTTNLGDTDLETEVFVLSHEFVHAQQDVDIGLQDFFDEHATTSDGGTATRSVTEGEAVHYSNLTLARRSGLSLTPQLFDEYYAAQQQVLRDAAAGSPDSDVGYTDLSSLFPYSFGGQLVTERWFSGGDPGVLELYEAPPPSSGAVLRTIDDQQPLALDPVTVSVGTLPEGYSLVAQDTLGAWILYAYALRSGIDEPTASALAKDWQGDEIVVAGGATETDVAQAWALRFGDPSSAQALAAITTVAAAEGVRSVRVSGRDATIVMTQTEDQLAQWDAVFPAAAVEPGQELVTSSATRAPRRRLLPAPIDDPRGPRRAR
ncbi:MAG: hypothetical protein AB1Z98_26125, partial [Nannocystaceae bacterium]